MFQTFEPRKFTGHEWDFFRASATDDLDYMHARFYSPHLSRFLSLDPVGGDPRRPQSWNRYAYVQGNPLKYVDPTGEVIGFATITVTLTQELTLARVQCALVEQRQAQMVQQTSALLQTELWKVSTANQRLELIVKVAASIGKSPQETVSLAFSLVRREGPFPRLAAQELKAFSLSTSRHRAAMSGGDKSEHILANAYLVMAGPQSRDFLSGSYAAGALLELGQHLDPSGVFDPEDIDANRASGPQCRESGAS